MKQLLTLYKNFNQSKPYIEQYEVEFKGDKARLNINTLITTVHTRFNKLTKVGQTCSGNHYMLTVNKKKVFFISTYDIFK